MAMFCKNQNRRMFRESSTQFGDEQANVKKSNNHINIPNEMA